MWEGFENDGTPPPWTNYHDPIMAYNHSSDPPTPAAVDITGGVFYPANSQFGAAFAGKYFFADAGAGFIRYFDPANPGTVGTPDTSSAFASALTTFGPVDLKVDADGNLYYLARGGEVHRISYTGDYGASEVVARQLFYNNSVYDGNDPSAGETDDDAIATIVVAYRAGDGTASPQNVSSYSRGINGVMIDVAGNHGPLSADDFTFRVGESNDLGTWTSAPAPSSILVRPGAGVSGSSRVEIIWDDGAIANSWLEVTLEGDDAAGGFNTDTGLAESDTFYFGSRLGDALSNSPASLFVTNVSDEIGARNNVSGNVPITNVYDFDRNGLINVADQIVARNNIGVLNRLSVPGMGTPASAIAETENGREAVATALSVPAAEQRANEMLDVAGSIVVDADVTARRSGRGASVMVEGNASGRLGRMAVREMIDLALDDELLDELLESALS